MATLDNVEIFSVGTWNGEKFTLADLEQIARNFEILKSDLRPPLKLGHDTKQVLDQKDGQPALGWVASLKVTGDKLVAMFQDVSEVVAEAINAGRYKRVSSELFLNTRKGGKKLGMALKAVALLGADLPAVTNLADLPKLLSKEGGDNLATFSDDRVVEFTVEKGTIQTFKLNEVQVSDKIGNDPALEAELVELRQFKAGNEKLAIEAKVLADAKIVRLSQEKFGSDKRHFMEKVGELVKAGQLEPQLSTKIGDALETQAANFTMESELMLPASLMLDTVKEFSSKLPKGEQGHDKGKPGVDTSDDPSGQLANEVKKYKALHPDVTDEDATEAVFTLNPELAKAYTDENLEFAYGDEGRA